MFKKVVFYLVSFSPKLNLIKWNLNKTINRYPCLSINLFLSPFSFFLFFFFFWRWMNVWSNFDIHHLWVTLLSILTRADSRRGQGERAWTTIYGIGYIILCVYTPSRRLWTVNLSIYRENDVWHKRSSLDSCQREKWRIRPQNPAKATPHPHPPTPPKGRYTWINRSQQN